MIGTFFVFWIIQLINIVYCWKIVIVAIESIHIAMSIAINKIVLSIVEWFVSVVVLFFLVYLEKLLLQLFVSVR